MSDSGDMEPKPEVAASSGESSTSEREETWVYVPKPEFSQLTRDELLQLKQVLTKRANEIYPHCKFGANYKRRYPALPKPKNPDDNPLPSNFEFVEKDGTVKNLVFRPAEVRAEDEAAVAAGLIKNVTLPTFETPTYLDFVAMNLPPGSVPAKLLSSKNPAPAETTMKEVDVAPTAPPVEEPEKSHIAPVFSGVALDNPDSSREEEGVEEKVPNFEYPSPFELLKMSPEEQKKSAAATAEKLHEVFRYVMKKEAEEKEARKRAKAEKRAAAAEARKKAREEELARLILAPGQRRRSCTLSSGSGSHVESRRVSEPSYQEPGRMGEDSWLVEKILDDQLEVDENGVEVRTYKVKWYGWGSEYNSWIQENDFNGLSKVNAYWRQKAKAERSNS